MTRNINKILFFRIHLQAIRDITILYCTRWQRFSKNDLIDLFVGYFESLSIKEGFNMKCSDSEIDPKQIFLSREANI